MAAQPSELGRNIREQPQPSGNGQSVGYEPNFSLYNLGETHIPKVNFWQDPHDVSNDYLKKANPPSGIDPYIDLVNELAELEAKTTVQDTKQTVLPTQPVGTKPNIKVDMRERKIGYVDPDGNWKYTGWFSE